MTDWQALCSVSGVAIAFRAFFLGYYKGRCDEMDSQKTVDIRMEPAKVTVLEKIR